MRKFRAAVRENRRRPLTDHSRPWAAETDGVVGGEQGEGGRLRSLIRSIQAETNRPRRRAPHSMIRRRPTNSSSISDAIHASCDESVKFRVADLTNHREWAWRRRRRRRPGPRRRLHSLEHTLNYMPKCRRSLARERQSGRAHTHLSSFS